MLAQLTAQSGDMKATARVRVIPSLPWTEDFETIELEKIPTHWIGATGKFFVREKDGGQSFSQNTCPTRLKPLQCLSRALNNEKTIRFKWI